MYTNIQRAPESRHEESPRNYPGFGRFRELEGRGGAGLGKKGRRKGSSFGSEKHRSS